ncbi:hypothetical protein SAMN04487995_0885 [Dyadobacter koreensis]|uniref:Uncharacterized protein n=1 Tax=Dyadobacter koreensis TaxID=408657 RepID=A0A1H6QPZ4_9BACT|nr:hypothetical protein [Dyadobacter koreensis]SEI45721.1 hypothetical protein SAMN04487995_0885 [Dyadobacter koreensis]
MKILDEILDSDATFGMKVLRSLSSEKKANSMSSGSVNLWDDLKDAAKDVRQHKEGKVKLQSLDEFVNEV